MCGKPVFIVMKYLVLRFPQKIKLDSWGNRFFVDFISFKKDLSTEDLRSVWCIASSFGLRVW